MTTKIRFSTGYVGYFRTLEFVFIVDAIEGTIGDSRVVLQLTMVIKCNSYKSTHILSSVKYPFY